MYLRILLYFFAFGAPVVGKAEIVKAQAPAQNSVLEKIQLNRHHPEMLAQLLPIVCGSFTPSKYERLLLTQLRDKNTGAKDFRLIADIIGELLAGKVVESLATTPVNIETPVTKCTGEVLANSIELVSIMRSGDALLEVFMKHFSGAPISKFLVQRDETTAEPLFKYMKLSPTIAQGADVVITEPMIATGGTLGMVIRMLKEKGVREENIIVACVCAAPEGLLNLNKDFPAIRVVMTVLDQQLNDKQYIVPGLGDFGDRYFGTTH